MALKLFLSTPARLDAFPNCISWNAFLLLPPVSAELTYSHVVDQSVFPVRKPHAFSSQRRRVHHKLANLNAWRIGYGMKLSAPRYLGLYREGIPSFILGK
jgi:hypothetical protein